MRQAIFLEKELFGKPDFLGVSQMVEGDLDKLKTKFNKKFGTYIIQGAKFVDVLHDFMDRRKLPK